MLRDKQALMDIAIAIQQTLLYAQDINRDNLQENDEKQAAILYRLIVIGEATKRLSIIFFTTIFGTFSVGMDSH